MLRAMIAEHPAHLAHTGHEEHIRHENGHADNTFDEVQSQIAVNHTIQEAGNHHGQQEEQHNGKANTHHHGNAHNGLLEQLVSQHLFQPFVKF